MTMLTLDIAAPDPAADWRTDPDIRRTFIGGSDAAAVFGVDLYRSPVAVWLEKLGRGDGFAGNSKTDWGLRHERTIAEWVADTYPDWTVIDPGGATWRHADHPFMACTPDRFVFDADRGWGNLQIKTTDQRNAGQWTDGDAPDAYRVQVAHEMEVLGLTWSALVCLVGGNDPHVVIQDADDELTAALVAAECDFWDHVERAVEPPLVGHVNEASDLARVWQADADRVIDLTGTEADDALREFADLKAHIEDMTRTSSRLRAIVEAAMGEATVATIDGHKVATWGARTEVDIARLQAENPALYELCLEPQFSLDALKRCQPAAAKQYRRTAGRTFRLATSKES